MGWILLIFWLLGWIEFWPMVGLYALYLFFVKYNEPGGKQE